jgi:polyisoprenoid-binding protein YceI
MVDRESSFLMTSSQTSQSAQITGGTWAIDKNHSLIEFAAKHFDIAYVKGRFKNFSGTITVDESDLLKSQVQLEIDATSLDSQAVQMREDLIKGEEMLEVDKYPTITFKSKSVQQKDLANYVVTGDLTLRGITREIQVPVEFGGLVNTRMGPRAGFSGTLTVNKSEFNVPFNREFEPGRQVVNDNIKIELQIEAGPQQPPSA